ncbi:hypothetical protein ACTFIZ_011963 [Dictyostelium cf. discoideum]
MSINSKFTISDVLLNKESLQKKNKYSCPICFEYFYKKSIYQCKFGHIACQECWEKSLKNKKECMICRFEVNSTNDLSRCLIVEQNFGKKECYCIYSFTNNYDLIDCANEKIKLIKDEENGCKEIIKIDELDTHIQNCKFKFIECSHNGCDKFLRLNSLKEHENKCGFKLVKCEYCDCDDIIKMKLEDHHTECSKFPIYCPQSCLNIIERDQIKSHIENDCNNSTIPCKYYEYGCKVDMMRSELQNHLNNINHQYFMGILIEKLTSTLTQSHNIQKELVKKIEQSEKTQEKLIKEFEQSKIVSDKLVKKIEQSEKTQEKIIKEFDRSKIINDKLVKNIEQSDKTQENLKNEFDQSKIISDKLVKKIEQSEKTQEKLIKEFDQSKIVSDKLVKKIEKSDKTQEKLKNEFDQSKVIHDKLVKKIEQSDKTQEKLKNEFDQSKIISDKLVTKIEQSEKTQEMLIKEFDQSKIKSDKLVKKIEQSEKNQEKINKELEKPKICDELFKKIEQSDKAQEKLKNEFDQSKIIICDKFQRKNDDLLLLINDTCLKKDNFPSSLELLNSINYKNKWIISQYSKIVEKYPNELYLKSPSFKIYSNNFLKSQSLTRDQSNEFLITIYPNGLAEYADKCSILLEGNKIEGTNIEFFCKFVNVLDKQKSKKLQFKKEFENIGKKEWDLNWGWFNFIESKLITQENGWLSKDDKLTIKFKVKLFNNVIKPLES